MPAVNFIVQWPDGRSETCYSPSTVIYEYLDKGQSYTLDDFMQRSEQALSIASQRVKDKFGYFCSSASDQLATIRERVQQLKQDHAAGAVIVVDMNH